MKEILDNTINYRNELIAKHSLKEKVKEPLSQQMCDRLTRFRDAEDLESHISALKNAPPTDNLLQKVNFNKMSKRCKGNWMKQFEDLRDQHLQNLNDLHNLITEGLLDVEDMSNLKKSLLKNEFDPVFINYQQKHTKLKDIEEGVSTIKRFLNEDGEIKHELNTCKYCSKTKKKDGKDKLNKISAANYRTLSKLLELEAVTPLLQTLAVSRPGSPLKDKMKIHQMRDEDKIAWEKNWKKNYQAYVVELKEIREKATKFLETQGKVKDLKKSLLKFKEDPAFKKYHIEISEITNIERLETLCHILINGPDHDETGTFPEGDKHVGITKDDYETLSKLLEYDACEELMDKLASTSPTEKLKNTSSFQEMSQDEKSKILDEATSNYSENMQKTYVIHQSASDFLQTKGDVEDLKLKLLQYKEDPAFQQYHIANSSMRDIQSIAKSYYVPDDEDNSTDMETNTDIQTSNEDDIQTFPESDKRVGITKDDYETLSKLLEYDACEELMDKLASTSPTEKLKNTSSFQEMSQDEKSKILDEATSNYSENMQKTYVIHQSASDFLQTKGDVEDLKLKLLQYKEDPAFQQYHIVNSSMRDIQSIAKSYYGPDDEDNSTDMETSTDIYDNYFTLNKLLEYEACEQQIAAFEGAHASQTLKESSRFDEMTDGQKEAWESIWKANFDDYYNKLKILKDNSQQHLVTKGEVSDLKKSLLKFKEDEAFKKYQIDNQEVNTGLRYIEEIANSIKKLINGSPIRSIGGLHSNTQSPDLSNMVPQQSATDKDTTILTYLTCISDIPLVNKYIKKVCALCPSENLKMRHDYETMSQNAQYWWMQAWIDDIEKEHKKLIQIRKNLQNSIAQIQYKFKDETNDKSKLYDLLNGKSFKNHYTTNSMEPKMMEILKAAELNCNEWTQTDEDMEVDDGDAELGIKVRPLDQQSKPNRMITLKEAAYLTNVLDLELVISHHCTLRDILPSVNEQEVMGQVSQRWRIFWEVDVASDKSDLLHIQHQLEFELSRSSYNEAEKKEIESFVYDKTFKKYYSQNSQEPNMLKIIHSAKTKAKHWIIPNQVHPLEDKDVLRLTSLEARRLIEEQLQEVYKTEIPEEYLTAEYCTDDEANVHEEEKERRRIIKRGFSLAKIKCEEATNGDKFYYASLLAAERNTNPERNIPLADNTTLDAFKDTEVLKSNKVYCDTIAFVEKLHKDRMEKLRQWRHVTKEGVPFYIEIQTHTFKDAREIRCQHLTNLEAMETCDAEIQNLEELFEHSSECTSPMEEEPNRCKTLFTNQMQFYMQELQKWKSTVSSEIDIYESNYIANVPMDGVDGMFYRRHPYKFIHYYSELQSIIREATAFFNKWKCPEKPLITQPPQYPELNPSPRTLKEIEAKTKTMDLDFLNDVYDKVILMEPSEECKHNFHFYDMSKKEQDKWNSSWSKELQPFLNELSQLKTKLEDELADVDPDLLPDIEDLPNYQLVRLKFTICPQISGIFQKVEKLKTNWNGRRKETTDTNLSQEDLIDLAHLKDLTLLQEAKDYVKDHTAPSEGYLESINFQNMSESEKKVFTLKWQKNRILKLEALDKKYDQKLHYLEKNVYTKGNRNILWQHRDKRDFVLFYSQNTIQPDIDTLLDALLKPDIDVLSKLSPIATSMMVTDISTSPLQPSLNLSPKGASASKDPLMGITPLPSASFDNENVDCRDPKDIKRAIIHYFNYIKCQEFKLDLTVGDKSENMDEAEEKWYKDRLLCHQKEVSERLRRLRFSLKTNYEIVTQGRGSTGVEGECNWKPSIQKFLADEQCRKLYEEDQTTIDFNDIVAFKYTHHSISDYNTVSECRQYLEIQVILDNAPEDFPERQELTILQQKLASSYVSYFNRERELRNICQLPGYISHYNVLPITQELRAICKKYGIEGRLQKDIDREKEEQNKNYLDCIISYMFLYVFNRYKLFYYLFFFTFFKSLSILIFVITRGTFCDLRKNKLLKRETRNAKRETQNAKRETQDYIMFIF